MNLKIYQVDAFTERVFGGNPAAIMPLTEWLPDALLQNLAAENNLSETAFIVPKDFDTEGVDFLIRWMTPSLEVRLCGHATLAAAHVLFAHLDFQKPTVLFDSKSGVLKVSKTESGYVLDFPADFIQKNTDENAAELIEKVLKIKPFEKVLKIKPLEIYRGKDDFVAVLPTAKDVAELKPDFLPLKNLDARGLIATARGEGDLDFVSRCFYPEAGIEEDPVTGSAHTALTPFWSEKLGKTTLKAAQISARRGDLICTLNGERVELAGNAVTYMIGEVVI